jgi:hypothetical protein
MAAVPGPQRPTGPGCCHAISEEYAALRALLAIFVADAGIRSDRPDYRAQHRSHLIDYVNSYLVR